MSYFIHYLQKYYSTEDDDDEFDDSAATADNDDDSEDEAMDEDDVEQKKRGRPKKKFPDSGYDSQKRMTNDLLDEIRQTATEIGTSFFDLITWFGMREANVIGDNELSELFKHLNRTYKDGQPKIAPQKALALKKKLVIGRNKYQVLVKTLGANYLPSVRKMAEAQCCANAITARANRPMLL